METGSNRGELPRLSDWGRRKADCSERLPRRWRGKWSRSKLTIKDAEGLITLIMLVLKEGIRLVRE